MSLPLSILDLAPIPYGGSAAQTFSESVALAQAAEAAGYRRVWYAEHHNMPGIASSATAVLIAHVANHTSTIRLGAGGIMLPNHSPLVIAEQFGTLETLFPGRIDLGLGRAPGSDMATFRALRRDPAAADAFPHDVLELQAFLAGESRIPGVDAYPGKGTGVPLYMLGSSLFGARLAAQLGLPYAFASHFAPEALQQAVALYRREFRPSEQLAEPYVLAGVGVVAADSNAEAHSGMERVRRERVRRFVLRGQTREFTDDEVDAIIDSGSAEQVLRMLTYTAVGSPDAVRDYLEGFVAHAGADELITMHALPEAQERLHSIELTAHALGLAGAVR
ncbi:putative luciferase-like protein [Zafaria cholistanensis]|uniref:Putative luciferase-like protein n=1 Tax=Zafaria cholistanensis TaxID=1682741 RepID=A0A5A7NTY1_9MICC|nr:LLM class flavin-dependent oxidoreductase [Zafaria cholistanensis]GER23211.1 putative luciferase-like protein [Zafaria cholistanensis]